MRFQSVSLPPLYVQLSPNRSSRNEQAPRGIVVHETEGSFLGAVSWLCNPRADASAHLVLSEDGKRACQLVPWHEKAWHAMNANRYTLGLELAGFASKGNSALQLRKAARIVAFWGHNFDIPMRQADSHGMNGVCRHRDLGAYGGNHSDPGGFDWEDFLALCAQELRYGRFRPVWGRS